MNSPEKIVQVLRQRMQAPVHEGKEPIACDVEALAALLPAGGFQRGSLVEWETDCVGSQAITLAMASLRTAVSAERPLVIVDGQGSFSSRISASRHSRGMSVVDSACLATGGFVGDRTGFAMSWRGSGFVSRPGDFLAAGGNGVPALSTGGRNGADSGHVCAFPATNWADHLVRFAITSGAADDTRPDRSNTYCSAFDWGTLPGTGRYPSTQGCQTDDRRMDGTHHR